MLQTRTRSRLAVVATAAGVAVAGVTAVLAATTATVVPVGGQAPTLQIEAGRVLEMTIDTAMSKPEYSWILTRDRKFINAQRSRFFQTRQTVPAAYVLDVNIQDTVNNQTEYRVFNVVVNPATDAPRTKRQTEGELRAVLTADLWNGQDTIMLPPEGGIVRLDMQQSVGDIASFSLDLDTGVDSDGDGDLENDKDNALTAGEKDATPLYVYILPKSTPRRIILTVTNPDNTQTSKAILNVSFTGQQVQPPTPGTTPSVTPPSVTVGNNSILAEKRGLTVTFSGRIDQTVRATRELLLEWDFGDRSRSLLNSPVHTYVKNGVYTVNLTVKDIATGEVLLTGSETIQVQAEQPTTPVTPSTPGTTPTTPVKVTPTTTTKSGGSIGSIIKVIFIVFFLIALAVGMFFVLRWLKNKTAGKLQQTLDKMENTIVDKQEEKEGQKKATTMKLKKEKKVEKTEVAASEPEPVKAEEVSAQETSKSDMKTGEAALASAPLASQDAPVPDWLKGGSSPAPIAESAPMPVVTEPSPMATQDAPVPDWLKPQTPQAAPVVETTPAAVEPAQADPAAIPDWLKGPSTTTVAPPEPAPAPATTPAPTPAPAPLAAQDAPVPDWLKPAATQAPSAAPAPVIEPKPLDTQSAPVPDWLQPQEQKIETPQTTVATDAAQAPAAQPAQPEPAPQQPASVPDWLKDAQAPAATPASPSAEPTETPAVVVSQAPAKPSEATVAPKNEPPAPPQPKETKPKQPGNNQPRKPQQQQGQPKRQPQQQGKPRSPQGNNQKPQQPKPTAQPSKPAQPEPLKAVPNTETEDAPIAIIKAESISAPEPEKKVPETKDIPRA